MSDAPVDGQFAVRGAIDLSSLARPSAPQPGEPGGAPQAGGFTVDLTEETFPSVVQQSTAAPVVINLWVPTDAASAQLATTLDTLATLYEGRFLHARVDVSQWPRIAGAFQVQDYPTVVGLINQQPVPLFAGNHDASAVQQVLDQFLAAAQANGVTGTLTASDAPAAEPEEEPLPPLHQKAFDAINEADYETAAAAYTQALREDPRDAFATAGLAQVNLLSRTSSGTRAQAQAQATENPDDIEAAMLVTDFALLEGDVQSALDALIERISLTSGDERELVRKRLIEYFEVLGNDDPHVGPARRKLASALY